MIMMMMLMMMRRSKDQRIFRKEYLEKTDHIRLNIGITGEPGTGKSTFVNAFRGLDHNDVRAAPTGCGNTTINPTSYCHPDYPNVILWDLPGIGSTMWPADSYVERVELEKFDFFIIISANRFRENYVKLANEIQKMGKKFYFIRSKINHNLRDKGRSQKDFNEEKTVETIIEDCIQGLNNLGIESPQVFLLSIPDLKQHGLKELKSTFEKELPELQRTVQHLTKRKLYIEDLNMKKESFEDKIEMCSVLSAVGSFLPVPLPSAVIDLSLMSFFIRQFVEELSQKNLAAITNPPCDDFRITSIIYNELKLKIILALKVLTQVANTSILVASMRGYSFFPTFRIPAVCALSFITTYAALNLFVVALVEKAQRMFKGF